MQDFNRTGDSEVPSGEVRRLLKEENDGLLLEKLKYEHRRIKFGWMVLMIFGLRNGN
jgi:hypothetical protein